MARTPRPLLKKQYDKATPKAVQRFALIAGVCLALAIVSLAIGIFGSDLSFVSIGVLFLLFGAYVFYVSNQFAGRLTTKKKPVEWAKLWGLNGWPRHGVPTTPLTYLEFKGLYEAFKEQLDEAGVRA